MSAAEQLDLDLAAPTEVVKLVATTSRRDACGICDQCGGATWGNTYARQVGARMMLRCKACDGRKR